MDYKELVERLNEWNENLISKLCADDVLTCDDLCGCTGDCIVVQAATAITDLLARAEAAEDRAEKAERERDAAVSDLTFAVNQYRLFTTDIDLCGLCKFDLPPAGGNGQTHECPGFYKDNCFEWRGQKEE